MSLEAKMRAVAQKAALEAASGERARCLWILDQLVTKAEQGLQKKMMTLTEEQLARVRMELTKAIVQTARTLIVSGIRPKETDVSRIQAPDGSLHHLRSPDGEAG